MNSMKNCYDGHGAVNMVRFSYLSAVLHLLSAYIDAQESPKDASAGKMSLYDCQQLCDRTEGCTAIGVSNADDASPGFINCYRKKDVDLGKCDNYIPFDTWTKVDYSQRKHKE